MPPQGTRERQTYELMKSKGEKINNMFNQPYEDEDFLDFTNFADFDDTSFLNYSFLKYLYN